MIPLACSTDHPGIIAREVNDLPLMLQALAGYDPRDPTSAMMPAAIMSGRSRRRPSSRQLP
jgi:aspartyl-tRNA(Asn)/glutamyl-tRNA(Gln) amidotransferase subunit A